MARKTIYVTGHKHPDTDSIISAMAYAYFKQQLGYDAMAVRIGELNQETEFVLNLFNEFAPPLVKDIKTCIRDIDFDDVITCNKDDTLYTALMKMRKYNKKVIAVVNKKRELLGMATISDITSPLIPHQDYNNKLIRETDISQIASFLQATLVYKADNQHTDGHVYIVADHDDKGSKDKIVITGSDLSIIRNIISNGAATVIVTKTETIPQDIIDLAKEKQCNLLISDKNIYDISKNIYYATTVDKVMSKELTTFKYDDYVDDVKAKINKSRYRSYPVLDSHNHIIGTLSRYHVFKHANRDLILVDHNELSQSIDGAQQANILEIIDHHRIGGLITSSPVYFRNEQVGCTATIIYKIFNEHNIEIPSDLAGLLCCAIISDTVNFKSVTCTQQDIDIAKKLSEIAELDLIQLGNQILAAGANLANKSPAAIFRNDLKQFEINNMKVTVSQCNIINFDSIKAIKDEMLACLSEYSRDSSSDIVMMAFSLIDGSGSYVLTVGKESHKLKDLFNKNGIETDEFVFLPKVISRKQQLVPLISSSLE